MLTIRSIVEFIIFERIPIRIAAPLYYSSSFKFTPGILRGCCTTLGKQKSMGIIRGNRLRLAYILFDQDHFVFMRFSVLKLPKNHSFKMMGVVVQQPRSFCGMGGDFIL